MKAILRSLWIATALSGVVLLQSCSNTETPAEQANDTNDEMQQIADDAAKKQADTNLEWENQRNAILTDLRDLRDGIDKDLGKTNEDLAKKGLKASDRTKHEAMKAELEREKVRVDETIVAMEGGAEVAVPERETMRMKAEQTRDEVKTWWEKRKEEQDKHTDADYDSDGH